MGLGYTVMVKGLPLISLLLTRTWSLCWPQLTTVYDTLYWEGDVATIAMHFSGFLDHNHRLTRLLVGVASEMSSSSAVIFCWSEHGLPLESLSSTRKCVGWLAVAECRPVPLTCSWHV